MSKRISELYDRGPSELKVRRKKLYNSKGWKRLRQHVLLHHPECVQCGRAANVVDHIIPWEDDMALAYDVDNLQSLCESCHNKKTYQETERYRMR